MPAGSVPFGGAHPALSTAAVLMQPHWRDRGRLSASSPPHKGKRLGIRPFPLGLTVATFIQSLSSEVVTVKFELHLFWGTQL